MRLISNKYTTDHLQCNIVKIIYLAQVSIIYAEGNVYTFKQIASGILIDEKKFFHFLETIF